MIENTAIHHAIFVIEDSEVADFLHHPFQVNLRVFGVYTHKAEYSMSDFAFFLSADTYACTAYALEYSTHYF